MIQEITAKIMLGGIVKYAKLYEQDKKDVQIRLSKVDGGKIKYEMCANWQPKETVTFKNILNKKIDILQYEALATPVLLKSLELYNSMYEVDFDRLSIFIIKHKKSIALAVFDDFKNLKLITLKNHFEKIGM